MAKLTYIANIRLPTEKAHSIQIMKMCEAFAAKGVEIELVVPAKRNNLGESEIFAYYGVRQSFKITKIPSTDLLGTTTLLGRLFYWVDLATFMIGLIFKIHPEKGSIIYSRDPLLLAPFSPRDYTLAVEIHSLPPRTYLFYKMLYRVKGIITITQYPKDALIDNGFRENTVIVEPDAADLDQYDISLTKSEIRHRLSLPADKTLIGYVGALKTMGMEKGVYTGLEALRSVREAILVLVGGHDADIRFYKKLAADLGVSDRVIFTGRVTPVQVPLYLKSFDVLVAPFPDSLHYRHYMSPLKLFEYMASGTPMVLSDLPSLREIVDDSSAAFFAPGDPGDLARALRDVCDHPEEAKTKADKALMLVRKYTWVNRADRILTFLSVKSK